MRALTFFLLLVIPTVVALGQAGPQAVEVAPVKAGRAEVSRPLIASVEAVVRSTVAAEEGGLVAERMFDEGHLVKQGQTLVRVNTDLLRVQLQAAVGSKEALAAQVEQAKAERERATLEVERMTPVIEQRAAPQNQMDDAVRDMRVAEAILANRTAMLGEKVAELERLKMMIEKSELRAPFEGVVARRHVEVGQWIKQGDAVAEIVKLDPVYVRAAVPEGLAARLERGQPVRVTFDALGGDAITGEVDQILPEADPLSRTVAVKVLLPNPDGRIRPGYLARATFQTRSAEDLWLVPKDAVVRDARGARVVAMRNGVAEVVPVTVVQFASDTAAVSGELLDGEMVVTRGNEALRGGEPLNPPRPPNGGGGPGGPPQNGGGGNRGPPGAPAEAAGPATKPAGAG